MAASSSTSTSSPLLIAGTWLIVVIPAVWGLTFTVQNAMKLFTRTPPAATAPAANPASR